VARPRRSQASREALLEKGLELFSAQGYHGTGIKEIVDACGVPKGSFYNYFETKEAFVAEVIGRYVDDLVTLWDRFFGVWNGPVLEGLSLAFGVLIEQHARNGFSSGCLVANLAGELDGSTSACRVELARAFAAVNERMVTLIADGQARGEIRRDHDATVLAEFFWDAWEGSLLRAKVEGSPRPLQRTVDLFANDFLRGNAR